jgi:hypothetical protein
MSLGVPNSWPTLITGGGSMSGSKGKKSGGHSHGHGHRHGGTATLSRLAIKVNGTLYDIGGRLPFSNVTLHPAGDAIRVKNLGGTVVVSGQKLGDYESIDLTKGARVSINGMACVVTSPH